MATNDATLLRIKHQVLNEVAELAWEGKLEEKRNEIPYNIIPGPKAQFRCCIYREREIIRERIRLAEGLCPSGKDTKNVVQVISSACEDCPITRYVVTDNCQLCMGKACQSSCNFNAISMGRDRAYIDPDKCKECGKCSQACPYNAIAPTGGEIKGVDPHCVAYKRIFDEISERLNREMMGSFGLEMGGTSATSTRGAGPGVMSLMRMLASK